MPAACSIGIAFCTEGVSYLELCAAADRALYRAKRQGKGRFCVAPLVEAHEESEPTTCPSRWWTNRRRRFRGRPQSSCA